MPRIDCQLKHIGFPPPLAERPELKHVVRFFGKVCRLCFSHVLWLHCPRVKEEAMFADIAPTHDLRDCEVAVRNFEADDCSHFVHKIDARRRFVEDIHTGLEGILLIEVINPKATRPIEAVPQPSR